MALAGQDRPIDVPAFYAARLATHGETPEAVGWPNREKQELRFEVLCAIAPLSGSSVLDIGCGLGDLRAYLEQTRACGGYRGVDICPELVEAARRRDPQGNYDTADVLKQKMQPADYVIASGLFGLNLGNNVSYREAMLRRLWNLCERGLAVNFVSTFVDYEEDYLAYSDPRDVFTFCMRALTHRVVLRHDYLFNDFTIYLYKDATSAGRE